MGISPTPLYPMANTWTASAILLVVASRSVVALMASNNIINSGASVAGNKDRQQELPQLSEEVQRCFTDLRLGRSPGRTLNSSTEASLDACMSRCTDAVGCLAMTFRMSDGLCNLLDRTYEEKYEESDERVVADKIPDCEVEQAPAQPVLTKSPATVQQCFTEIVAGRSPGSTLGSSIETSIDDCMARCADLENCQAMTFRVFDGLCNALERTYEQKFEGPDEDERMVANKLVGCNSCVQKARALEAKRSDFSGSILDLLPNSRMGSCVSLCAAVEACYANSKHPQNCASLEATVDDCMSI